jgi:hypothetical protein
MSLLVPSASLDGRGLFACADVLRGLVCLVVGSWRGQGGRGSGCMFCDQRSMSDVDNACTAIVCAQAGLAPLRFCSDDRGGGELLFDVLKYTNRDW